MDKEMELLLSEKEVDFADKKIVVKRFSLLDTIRLASQASGVVAHILSNDEASANALTKLSFTGSTDNETNGVRIMGLLEILSILGDEGIDFIKNCISKSTNLDYEDVEKIDSVDGIDLIFAIYEVNKSFFNKLLDKTAKKKEKKSKTEK